jgi:hypothetical protein
MAKLILHFGKLRGGDALCNRPQIVQLFREAAV